MASDDMDDPLLWRRLLVNELFESAVRFAILAAMNGGFVGRMFAALSQERVDQTGAILRNFPDPELESQLVDRPGTTGDLVVEEEAAVVSGQGERAAADLAIDRERDLATLVADLGDAELPQPLRLQLLGSLRAACARLAEARDRTPDPRTLMRFSTKSADTVRPTPPQRVMEVWFGTNRMPVEDAGLVVGFSGETAPSTTLGRCGVTIPRTHKFGETDPPWWRRVVFGHRPLAVESVSVLAAEDFWTDVGDRLCGDGVTAEDAVVFLHGYNVSFEQAAVRTAQIAADLNLAGATAFFSWPSFARKRAYLADEASIEASEEAIAAFLVDFAARSGAERVHLIAHSMGNRGLLRAMDRIARGAVARAGKPFGQIILAAPDVDRRTFGMFAKAYAALGTGTTLYVSSKDWRYVRPASCTWRVGSASSRQSRSRRASIPSASARSISRSSVTATWRPAGRS